MPNGFRGFFSRHQTDQVRREERGNRGKSRGNETSRERLERLRREGTMNLRTVTDNSQGQPSGHQEFQTSQQSSEHARWMLRDERNRVWRATENMLLEQQWQTHRAFLQHVEDVSPELRAAYARTMHGEER